jgi:hypothetical protein
MMDKSMPNHLVGLSPDSTTQGLTPGQRRLIRLMREHQFGRIENMKIKEGQPVLNQAVRVVRIARLNEVGRKATTPTIEEFELKRLFRNLFDQLARLGNGTVIRLEFRHGLPFIIEIMAAIEEPKASDDASIARP